MRSRGHKAIFSNNTIFKMDRQCFKRGQYLKYCRRSISRYYLKVSYIFFQLIIQGIIITLLKGSCISYCILITILASFIHIQALTSANSALENDKNSPQTYFLLYKIHLVQNNEEKAIESVDKLTELNLQSDDSETIHGLICLAAQLAFEVNKSLNLFRLLKSFIC